ncbi:hypothetical protein GALMADRAFT_135442 [Galerina marginata CBS 339.88]|uniref:Carboxylic ester hydrolase n=1 Tax=Galerina marginata (strain CBS 339.88) TaxID=685588 RepID=A0A067TSX5_GALM3|nr:hypothetical protein GALMADRAFT_135442 [Galerina marginata CBS 339.88]
MPPSFPIIWSLAILFFTAVNAQTTTPAPTVTLSYGAFQGQPTGNLVEFLGIPFAAPPVGNLRFAPPQPPVAFSGVRPATTYGAACFQQSIGGVLGLLVDLIGVISFLLGTTPTNVSEDCKSCLFINVIKPANLPAGQKVPVLFWIYGGGFQFGDTSQNPGDPVVARSIALNEPIIWVSANYRISALGFLGGKEVKAAGIGNAGLRDQRFALQWVQDHIATFGGDPTKVTIWGGSAGAISVGLQMVANNGDPAGLFSGAFMLSGFPMALHDITHQQPFFDQLVSNTGCTGSADPIACLRAVPFNTLSNAINQSPGIFSYASLQLAWPPTVDGQFIVRNPQVSIQQGSYAKVPIIAGDCDDEGTLFSLVNTNITNNAQFLAYMQSNYFEGIASSSQLAAIGVAYPDDITQGSPFDTGIFNALSPEYKRLAAIQGDLEFHAPRRYFLKTASKTQAAFVYLSKRGKSTALFGAEHGSDANEWFGMGTTPDFLGTDALVNFVNTGNPNLPNNPNSLMSKITWPQWNSNPSNPPILTFLDSTPNITITSDTFRSNGIQLLIDIYLQIGTA